MAHSDDNRRPCPCCRKPLDICQIQRHLRLARGRFAQQLDLYYAEGAGEGADADDREVEGNANPVVADNAGEGANDEDTLADDGVSARNVEAGELAPPVIEMAPNNANSAVHDAGIDVPLEPAHGLRRNPPVTIEDWPDPEADAKDELYDDDDKPVGGPNCDPEYVERDLPARFDPIDEPRLADDEIREILQRHLGDLATQQWVDMYDRILSKRDRNMLGMLAARLRTHFSRDTWDDLRQGVCGDLNIPSEFIAWQRLRLLTQLELSAYDCCKYQDSDQCPFCHEARYNARGNPRRFYRYTPLIAQLHASFQQKELARKLGYRVKAERRFDPEVFEDIFDGNNYRTLRQTLLCPDSDYRFFDNPQDLALGISTDGFSLFKNWRRIQNRIDNVICVGVIPGPKQCKDLNSFLVPLLKELLALEEGVEMGGFVPGEDAPHNFILHAFLILSFGDIPAVAKMLLIKGHNTTLPIDELPMRSHAQTLAVFKKLDQLNVPRKKNKREELSRATGIVG
ncbi:hypothetical protein FRC06_008453, partial [Ceratobasidium sp. 370]